MNIKTSTKERFTVITITDNHLSANMTAEIEKLTEFVGQATPHVVLSMQEVAEIATEVGHKLAAVQQVFYDNDCSFVVCNIQPSVEAVLEQEELMEIMNITPTESEAWDIVQMEEIERELMNDFED
jgi:anti-anti-sigma regulatory factor